MVHNPSSPSSAVIDGAVYEGGDGVYFNNSCAPNAEYTMDWCRWNCKLEGGEEVECIVLPIVALRYVFP